MLYFKPFINTFLILLGGFILTSLLTLLGFDSVLSMIIVDTIIIFVAFSLLKRKNSAFILRSNILLTPQYFKWLLLTLFVFLYFFGQISASWILEVFGDSFFTNSYAPTFDVDPFLVVLLVIVVAPIAEELLFRGLFINDSLEYTSEHITIYIIIQSIIFCILHGTLVHLIPTFIFGLFLGVVVLYTNRILYSILFHVLYNLLATFLGGITIPNILFNPLVWGTILICIVVVLLIMLKYLKTLDHKILDNSNNDDIKYVVPYNH